MNSKNNSEIFTDSDHENHCTLQLNNILPLLSIAFNNAKIKLEHPYYFDESTERFMSMSDDILSPIVAYQFTPEFRVFKRIMEECYDVIGEERAQEIRLGKRLY